MSFAIERDDDLLTVVVDGQLVVGNRQELKQLVLDEVEQGARRVLIDFTDGGYIDSSGLGALVSLNKRVREQGGELRLAGLNDDLRTLFELTRLDTLFLLYGTRSDALVGF
jgi:anti-sigma B factor antagonist